MLVFQRGERAGGSEVAGDPILIVVHKFHRSVANRTVVLEREIQAIGCGAGVGLDTDIVTGNRSGLLRSIFGQIRLL